LAQANLEKVLITEKNVSDDKVKLAFCYENLLIHNIIRYLTFHGLRRRIIYKLATFRKPSKRFNCEKKKLNYCTIENSRIKKMMPEEEKKKQNFE
jgi:hypothetical protein